VASVVIISVFWLYDAVWGAGERKCEAWTTVFGIRRREGMGLSGRGKWYSFWYACAAAVSIIARTDLTKWVCRLSII
jgi:hypothetical protein